MIIYSPTPAIGKGLHVSIGIENMDTNIAKWAAMGATFKRASAAALKSMGYTLQREIKAELGSVKMTRAFAGLKADIGGSSLGWQKKNPWTRFITKHPPIKGSGKKKIGKGKKALKTKARGPRGKYAVDGIRAPHKKRKRIAKRDLTKNTNFWGQLGNAIAYKYYDDSHRVIVGILVGGRQFRYKSGTQNKRFYGTTREAQQIAGVIQTGFSTPVTPKMRKYFAAIGLYLKKSTTSVKTPERQLFAPMYKRLSEYLPRRYKESLLYKLAQYNKFQSISFNPSIMAA